MEERAWEWPSTEEGVECWTRLVHGNRCFHPCWCGGRRWPRWAALPQPGPTHSLGSMFLLFHFIQRVVTAASQLRYHSCQHLKVNTSPQFCIKEGTGITTTFDDDVKKSCVLTWPSVIYSLNFACITNTCKIFMGDNAMSANVE